MMERGDQSKEGRGGTCPLTGPVKPRDRAWWRGQAQVQGGGGSSLSGGAWLSVSQVSAQVVRGCVKVHSQVTNRWLVAEHVYLWKDPTAWGRHCVCKCVCEGRAIGRETLVIIRRWDDTVSNVFFMWLAMWQLSFLNLSYLVTTLYRHSSACFAQVSTISGSSRVKKIIQISPNWAETAWLEKEIKA